MSTFISLNSETWLIDLAVDSGRREFLLADVSFASIVQKLNQSARVQWAGRRSHKHLAGYFRVEAMIEVNETALDLFHNGCSGYRAQYYFSPLLGESANRLAVEQLSLLLNGSSHRGKQFDQS